MSQRKPLVLGDDGLTQQLQAGDEADIPLEVRVRNQQALFRELLFVLNENRITLTPPLLKELALYDDRTGSG